MHNVIAIGQLNAALLERRTEQLVLVGTHRIYRIRRTAIADRMYVAQNIDTKFDEHTSTSMADMKAWLRGCCI